MSSIFFLMSITTNVTIFQFLYVLMGLLSYLREPSTTILIAESVERSERRSVYARLGFIEGIGGVTGLAMCTLTVNLLGYKELLRLTCPLLLISFFLALLTIRDPALYIERFLDRYDRLIGNIETFSFHMTDRGTLAPTLEKGWHLGREPNMAFFGLGRTLFAFAASNAFTPLPIYLLAKAKFPTSTIFASFFIRSLFGAASFLVASRLVEMGGGRAVKLATGMRAVLINFLPMTILFPMPFSVMSVATLLSLIAFSWSLYSVGTDLTMVEYVSPGRLGFYDALSGIGGALGGFTAGLLPTLYGFETSFLISSGLFASALVFFTLGLG